MNWRNFRDASRDLELKKLLKFSAMDFDSKNRTVVPINNETVKNFPSETSPAKAR